MMGGFTYTTKQGDMWDYIAWRVYGDESLVYLLYRENPKYLDTFIFDEGVKLYCPEVEVINEDEDEDEYYDDELEKVEDKDIEINKDVDYSIVWRQSTK